MTIPLPANDSPADGIAANNICEAAPSVFSGFLFILGNPPVLACFSCDCGFVAAACLRFCAGRFNWGRSGEVPDSHRLDFADGSSILAIQYVTR
jgi:hypothetical protein